MKIKFLDAETKENSSKGTSKTLCVNLKQVEHQRKMNLESACAGRLKTTACDTLSNVHGNVCCSSCKQFLNKDCLRDEKGKLGIQSYLMINYFLYRRKTTQTHKQNFILRMSSAFLCQINATLSTVGPTL